MAKPIIGVMGPGSQATSSQIETAHALGYAIAQAGWVLLTGGRAAGVMEAASRGAKAGGGLTVGVLPGPDRGGMSSSVDIPIVTGLGNGRNIINVLSSDVIVACGLGSGTAAEVALAIKAQKPLIFMETNDFALTFWQNLSPYPLASFSSVEAAMIEIRGVVGQIHSI